MNLVKLGYLWTDERLKGNDQDNVLSPLNHGPLEPRARVQANLWHHHIEENMNFWVWEIFLHQNQDQILVVTKICNSQMCKTYYNLFSK